MKFSASIIACIFITSCTFIQAKSHKKTQIQALEERLIACNERYLDLSPTYEANKVTYPMPLHRYTQDTLQECRQLAGILAHMIAIEKSKQDNQGS